jgi:hypothetical protein
MNTNSEEEIFWKDININSDFKCMLMKREIVPMHAWPVNTNKVNK